MKSSSKSVCADHSNYSQPSLHLAPQGVHRQNLFICFGVTCMKHLMTQVSRAVCSFSPFPHMSVIFMDCVSALMDMESTASSL